MSLRPDDRSSRSKSKSKSGTRDRSRSNVRAPQVPSPPSSSGYGYAQRPPPPSSMPGSFNNSVTSPSYEVRAPHPGTAERSASYGYPPQAANIPYPEDGGFTMGGYTDLPPHERPGYVPPPGQAQFPQYPPDDDHDLAYGDYKTPISASRQTSYSNSHPAHTQYPSEQPLMPSMPDDYSRYVPGMDHAPQPTYQYAQPPDKITYTAKPQTGLQTGPYGHSPRDRSPDQHSRDYRSGSYSKDGKSSRDHRSGSYSHDAQYVDITPGSARPKNERKSSSSSKAHRLSVDTQQQGLGQGMGRLSVSGNRPDLGGMPPASPLLEAYRGTYQSLSPMPLALRDDDDELSDIEPLDGHGRKGDKKNDKLAREAEREKEKKRVKLYDAEDDAKKIAGALNHHKVDPNPVIDVLPGLSHDQIWELRKEYKKQVKIQGKGINLPKHLKMKLTGNFGKAAHVTALGKYEGEGYWANFFYQSHGSRRELLIESLMGRSNGEIGYIKDEFKDKRYADSLVKCMEKELKMDKFRSAVLMALEGRRQEEQDVYPTEYRNQDVEILHRALGAKQGGESAMLEVVMRRSDAHLKSVLDTYQRMYQENFARAALKKCNNLIGEVIAHILNGVINKPARDALLLQHAIKDIADRNKDDDLRYELLISRLVRLHWDRAHLVRVKRAYAERCGKELQEDIEAAAKGDFREFMCELAETR